MKLSTHLFLNFRSLNNGSSNFISFSCGRILIALLIPTLVLFNTGCEDDDDNKLSKAQECLDKVSDTDIPSAQACAAMVAGVNSDEANVIRCSVGFIVGGVTTSKITGAFDAYNAAPANQKPVVLMAALSHSSTTLAAATVAACKASHVSSLDYLSTISQVGTALTDGAPDLNPATAAASAAAQAAACAGGTPPPSCDPAVVGAAVISMYSVYCIGDAATTPACADVGSAIAAGGTPADIANALYGFLK